MKNIYILILLIFGTLFFNSCVEDYRLPSVVTNDIIAIKATSAVGGGKIATTDIYPVTARGVCWSTKKNQIIYDGISNSGEGVGTFASSIKNLKPNTTYYVRAFATNTYGTAFGNVCKFKTSGIDVSNDDTFTDSRDGTTYKTVQIGYQVWMAENLKYLPKVNPPNTVSIYDAYYYVYGYDGTNVNEAKATTNYKTYGVLYNWSAAMSGEHSSSANPSGVRGVCPKGWHLPSDEEWDELLSFVNDDINAAYMLKSETGWNYNGNGSNEFGFSALPGGERENVFNNFRNIKNIGTWWSSTEFFSSSIWNRSIEYNYNYVNRHSSRSDFAYSVRCVKDK